MSAAPSITGGSQLVMALAASAATPCPRPWRPWQRLRQQRPPPPQLQQQQQQSGRQRPPWRQPARGCQAPPARPCSAGERASSIAAHQQQQREDRQQQEEEQEEEEEDGPAPRSLLSDQMLMSSAYAPGEQLARSAPGEPDLVLPAPPGGGPIYVFGCVHADYDSPQMAQFIMEHRPHSVVVETAADPAHGSATGNVLRREDALRLHSDPRTRGWAQLGVQLAGLGPGALGSALWRDLSAGRHRLCSEHLVYAASFAVGAELVFGDRPKRVTYHRLLWCPSVEDLDAAYGVQSALNYHELVSTLRPFNDVRNTNCVHRVLILERDATMLHALHEASLRAGPGGCVVGVVGASHLAGMRHLWEGGRWRQLMAGGELLRMPDVEAVAAAEAAERLAVRWALFRAVLRLTCRPDVIRDVRAVVGPVPPHLKHVYCLTAELYGSSRMLLAVLNPDQLAEVCQGWRCDFYDVLAPLRAVRPINGGPGYDEELVLELRTLQFELEGPE